MGPESWPGCEHEACKHEPDWLTAETWRADDGGVYLYVDCTLCGDSGCVGIAEMLALGIEWDNTKGDSQ